MQGGAGTTNFARMLVTARPIELRTRAGLAPALIVLAIFAACNGGRGVRDAGPTDGWAETTTFSTGSSLGAMLVLP